MKEDFLHYIWNNKKFDFSSLTTVCNKKIAIIDTGHYIQASGADFFNAQLVIDDLRWAGNVEIHLNASDWYLHNHHKDTNYDNVILHVVWNYDMDVYRKDNSEIPVLQLKDYVSLKTNDSYMDLTKTKSWIFCENQIGKIEKDIWSNWKDKLFIERVEQKTTIVRQLLAQNKNDWEATLFCVLAKSFGLNTNGEIFLKIAQSIPFQVIRKESFEVENIEALLLGRAKLLSQNFEDNYLKDLQQRWRYLQTKYQLEDLYVDSLEFFKHRPDNFPTIRLAQLAMLYHKNQSLFEQLTQTNSLQNIYELFKTEPSLYWSTHYVLDKESPKKRKALSRNFIDLLIINSLIPIRFAYDQYQHKQPNATLKKLAQDIKPEKNNIIERFKKIGVTPESAFDTQALLQLKKQYCEYKRCMACDIGKVLIK